MEKKIVLASASPRRKEILEQVGIKFEVFASDADENIGDMEPERMVEELSRRKAAAAKEAYPGAADVFLAADTMVAYQGKKLGKPADKEEAFAMLAMLQGNTHEVYTGVTVIHENGEMTFSERTKVSVRPMTKEEINAYIATKEPFDKAGAYGIQGAFAAYIEGICGDYYNVMGLPVCRLCREMKALGRGEGE